MLTRIVFRAAVCAMVVGAQPAFANGSAPKWDPSVADRIPLATAYTVAPVLPIPFGALQSAKLSNGATLVTSGRYLDLHDRRGAVIARFDHAGRTLEPPDRPVDLLVTKTSVVFLGGDHARLMTLPRH